MTLACEGPDSPRWTVTERIRAWAGRSFGHCLAVVALSAWLGVCDAVDSAPYRVVVLRFRHR